MNNKIEAVVKSAVKEMNEELGSENLAEPSSGTGLYGANGNLDSIGLVSLLMDIEERVTDEFDCDVSLTDERAMSRKNSPFRTIKTLSDYIYKLLEKEKVSE